MSATQQLTARTRKVMEERTIIEIFAGTRLVATIRPSADGLTIASDLVDRSAVTVDALTDPPEMHIRLL